MAGSSFLRDRSPVTPKTTSAHGSGTRGSRRSRGSRRGLRGPAGFCFIGPSNRLAADGLQQLLQPGFAIGQVQPDHGPLPALQRLQVTERLGELQASEGEWLPGYVEVGGVRPSDLQEGAHLWAALVE